MIRTTLTIALLGWAAPALAQEEPLWSVSATAGTTAVDDAADQPFVSAALTRRLGPGYVQLAGPVIESGDADDPAGVLPARTLQATLSAGATFGRVTVDGYVALGTREFERGAVRGVAITSDGATAATGIALTLDVPLGERTLIAPFASVDYGRVDVSRTVLLPGRDPLVLRQKEEGTIGSAGATLTRLFAAGRHSVGLYGSWVTSSNGAVALRSVLPVAGPRFGRLGDRPGTSDDWVEFGALATIGLTERLSLDLSVVRTAGFAFGETTSASAGIALAF